MFSGIIEAQGKIITIEVLGKCKRVRMQKPRSWKLARGESISVDGICSTVVAKSVASFDVEYMPQTLSKTIARLYKKGSIVNLERSLQYGDRLHGHFVAGHVDTTSRVVNIERKGRSRLISIKTYASISEYIVPRGSIAVNGVSLTVAKKNNGFFTIALIPHTLALTNLSKLSVGVFVNVEVDMLARYGRLKPHAKKKRSRTRSQS